MKNWIETIELFNEKANRLVHSRFWQHITTKGLRLRLSSHGKPNLAAPDNDATQAFILTLRMFIQNNEPISLHNVCQLLEASSHLDDQKKKELREAHNRLNQYLDSPAMCQFKKGRPRRAILEFFIYGDLAHTNARKRQDFKEAQSQPWRKYCYSYEFLEIITTIVRFILCCKKEHEKILTKRST